MTSTSTHTHTHSEQTRKLRQKQTETTNHLSISSPSPTQHATKKYCIKSKRKEKICSQLFKYFAVSFCWSFVILIFFISTFCFDYVPNICSNALPTKVNCSATTPAAARVAENASSHIWRRSCGKELVIKRI